MKDSRPVGVQRVAMVRVVAAAVLSSALLFGTAAQAQRDDTSPLPIPSVALYDNVDATAAMVADVNAERARHGRGPLSVDAELTKLARAYARQMLSERFVGHVTPTGTTPLDRLNAAHYLFHVAAENLTFTGAGEDQAMANLIASPGHHRNMLDERFTRFGVAAVAASVYGTMYVQEFAGD